MTIKKWTYAVGFTAGLALVACSGENGQDGLPGVDGTSCVAKALKDSSGFEMYCGDELMGVIKNGADGADGKDGKNGTNGKDGKNGSSCAVKAIKDGFKVVCDGDSVGVLVNGVNGKNGDSGEDGKSAYELAVEAGFEGDSAAWLASLKGTDGLNGLNGDDGKSAYEIAKEKDPTIGTEEQWLASLNGENGASGKSAYELAVLNGFEGSEEEWLESLRCTLKDNGDGTVLVTCGDSSTTLFKAMCGIKPYDPEKSFCFNDSIVAPFCNGETYNPLEKFCSDNTLAETCGGRSYDVANEFCEENVVYSKCGGVNFKPSEKFCVDGTLYPTCDGKSYNVVDQKCEDDVVLTLCGDASDPDGHWYYDSTEAQCLHSKNFGDKDLVFGKYLSNNPRLAPHKKQENVDSVLIIRKNNISSTVIFAPYCGSTSGTCTGDCLSLKTGMNTDIQNYPGTYTYRYKHTLASGATEDAYIKLSKDNFYNASTQFCYIPEGKNRLEGAIVLKCGGATYDTTTHFCEDDKVQEKCGGYAYSTADYFCSDNMVLGKCGGKTFDPKTQVCNLSSDADTLFSSICGNNPITLTEEFVKKYPDSYAYFGSTVVMKSDHITFFKDPKSGDFVLPYGFDESKRFCAEIDANGFGQTYSYKKIGTQTWMTEDLAVVTTTSSGDTTSVCHTAGVSVPPGPLCTYNAYSWGVAMGFSDKAAEANSAYQFAAYDNPDMMSGGYNPPEPYQGICPDGWHLPTYTEFNLLLNTAQQYVNTYGGTLEKVLKSTKWDDGTDNLGFNARIVSGGSQFTLWGVTEWQPGYMAAGNHPAGATAFIIRKADSSAEKVQLSYGVTKTYNVAVRCVKNK